MVNLYCWHDKPKNDNDKDKLLVISWLTRRINHQEHKRDMRREPHNHCSWRWYINMLSPASVSSFPILPNSNTPNKVPLLLPAQSLQSLNTSPKHSAEMSGTIKAKTPNCNNWDTPDLLQDPKTTRSKEPVIPAADLVKLYQHIVSGKDNLAKGLKSISNDLGMTEAEVVLQTLFVWPRWNDWNDRDGGRRKSNWGTLLHLAVRYDKQGKPKAPY